MRQGFLSMGVAVTMVCIGGCTQTASDRKALADGYAAYQARRYEEAESAATGYLQKNPTAPNIDEAYYLRGLARLGRQDKGPAGQDLTLAIQKSTRKDLQAKAWRTLGDIAFDGQKWADAQRDYSNALLAGGGGDEAYVEFRIGEALQDQGRWDEGKVHLDKAATLGEPRAAERAVLRYFTLQFGSFQEATNANNLARELRAAGLSAGVFKDVRGAATMYAVRAGGYATLAAADAERGMLIAKYPLVAVYP